jgi:hypothetical protein
MKKIEIRTRAFTKNIKDKLPNFFNEAFLGDINIQVLLFVAGVIFVVTWIFAIVRFQPSDYLVPTRYNTFLGVTALGNWYQLYFVPLILTFCILLNFVLSNFTYKKDKMISYILVGSNIFLAISALAVVINFGLISGI